MKKLKLNTKSFVAGMLLMALLTPLIVVGSEVVTRQIHYGVNVVVNGQTLQLDGIDRPFIMDGRTFLPVRGIADALGVPADWDGATSTVFLGDRHPGQRTSLHIAAPYFDTNSWQVSFETAVSMGGVTYSNALQFGIGGEFSLHNLDGQFRTLSGYIGRVDGSNIRDVTFRFYGDGNLLQRIDLNATDLPVPINVFVEGVRQLRIEANIGNSVTGSPIYAASLYLE